MTCGCKAQARDVWLNIGRQKILQTYLSVAEDNLKSRLDEAEALCHCIRIQLSDKLVV